MQKTSENYNKWSNEKQTINSQINKNIPIHHREIWYVKLWLNIWYEEDGKWDFIRPVFVYKKLWNLYFCLPMTTKWKNNKRYHDIYSINFGKKSSIILSQWRSLDSSRFINQIGKVSAEEFILIKQKIAKMYG